ncbi:eyes absent protein, partial [Tanacetum coccineum]
IEGCNKPYVDAMREYDDGLDLTDYDFANDGFVGTAFDDDDNKKKLAYRHRIIAQKLTTIAEREGPRQNDVYRNCLMR